MMPSLKKRVSSYFRQLSFHNEPKNQPKTNDDPFVMSYLLGLTSLGKGPLVSYGKQAQDMPNYEIGSYDKGYETIVGCYTGPNSGLTTIKRTERHLSITDPDIDFIDTMASEEAIEDCQPMTSASPLKQNDCIIDNTAMVIKVAGQEYYVINKMRTRGHSKSHSLSSLSEFDLSNIEIDKTKNYYSLNNNNNTNTKDENHKSNLFISTTNINNNKKQRTIKFSQNVLERKQSIDDTNNVCETIENYNLLKTSEDYPFGHRNKMKKGKLVKANRANDSHKLKSKLNGNLPNNWNRPSDLIYGISDSLYECNQITKQRNGDPIADCFGIIARNDSAILAVADGVNWGDKATIAAKSAIHGCLHYLNQTIFNDAKLFNDLINNDCPPPSVTSSITSTNNNLLMGSRDICVCLLRAFQCAHDLILENNGMLTTLTVAIVLPLKNHQNHFICCICNVGDSLAYVYSKKYGLRELTKDSHDITLNRDLRDALGALGPVDGINPELNNLTLSVTKLQKGDLLFVASDGLTDNFDPIVSRRSIIHFDYKQKKNATTDASISTDTKTANVPISNSTDPSICVTTTNTDLSISTATKVANVPPISTNATDTPISTATKASAPPIAATKATDVTSDETNMASTSKDASQSTKVIITLTSKMTTATTTKPLNESEVRKESSVKNKLVRPQRSKTSIDIRPLFSTSKIIGSPLHGSGTNVKQIPEILLNRNGLPLITPLQRYELQQLIMENLICNSNDNKRLKTAKELCEELVKYTFAITNRKRNILENLDLYYKKDENGLLIELTQAEQRLKRKQINEKLFKIAGKLDHVTIVAWNVGNHVVQ